MNFDFSEDSVLLRDQARTFLRERCGADVVRRVLEGPEAYAADLWREMAGLGWLGAGLPEDFGGAGLGYETLCVLAEEMGRVLAPVPFAGSIYLAAEAILQAAATDQKQRWLPAVAEGASIGAFALAEGIGRPAAGAVQARAEGGRLHGVKWPVLDGAAADFALVAAADDQGIGLYHIALDQPGVTRDALETIDPSRSQARLTLTGAVGERLAAPGDHWPIVLQVLERAAVLMAFEQLGGAEACLHMARDYAMDRIAFGRPLASFQAIKHRLADVYVEVEIARSNAYYGAWALSEPAADLALAAAAARLAATEAFRIAAKENIQVHGGAGFTWEFDCHLYYRRAKALAVSLGGSPWWADRLVDRLEAPDGQEVALGL